MKARVLALAALLVIACGRNEPAVQEKASAMARLNLGTPASADEIAALDIDVTPEGVGLPDGRGTAQEGAGVYAAKCAVCHGANGEGLGMFPRLVGAEPRDSFPFAHDAKLVKTIGNYWPYATTVFDYTRRAMPFNAPGSLTSNEVYGLVAFLLAKNEIIADDFVVDARSLPDIRMPARKRFVPDNRRGGREFR